jgi:hypothetical protein
MAQSIAKPRLRHSVNGWIDVWIAMGSAVYPRAPEAADRSWIPGK